MQLDRVRARNLGYDGEDVVCDYFSDLGHSVIKSINPYDEEKDLTIDGVITEVKTQVPYRIFGTRRQPAFTIPISGDYAVRRNQLNKCMNTERLIFVRRPEHQDPTIKLYEAPAWGSRFFEVVQNTKDNRIVAGFYIADMKLLTVIKDQDLVERFMEERKWRNY